MPMPPQKPGRSRQDYGTPPQFLQAVKDRLGIEDFVWDLAASPSNSVTTYYWDEEQNSLVQDWHAMKGWQWLNPPFSHLSPWVEKCWRESQVGASIACLVPAGVGANWWRDWVDNKAHVIFLNGRLTFAGERTPYPKDCALLLYNKAYIGGYEVWNWRHF